MSQGVGFVSDLVSIVSSEIHIQSQVHSKLFERLCRVDASPDVQVLHNGAKHFQHLHINGIRPQRMMATLKKKKVNLYKLCEPQIPAPSEHWPTPKPSSAIQFPQRTCGA